MSAGVQTRAGGAKSLNSGMPVRGVLSRAVQRGGQEHRGPRTRAEMRMRSGVQGYSAGGGVRHRGPGTRANKGRGVQFQWGLQSLTRAGGAWVVSGGPNKGGGSSFSGGVRP